MENLLRHVKILWWQKRWACASGNCPVRGSSPAGHPGWSPAGHERSACAVMVDSSSPKMQERNRRFTIRYILVGDETSLKEIHRWPPDGNSIFADLQGKDKWKNWDGDKLISGPCQGMHMWIHILPLPCHHTPVYCSAYGWSKVCN